MRVIGFLGADTLFYLLIGRYHRPAFDRWIFLTLDMMNSTATAERLGPLGAMKLVRKSLFDLSKPINVDPRFRSLPHASVKGVKESVEIYEYLG